MKYIFLPMVTLMIGLTSCNNSGSSHLSANRYHDYDEVSDRTIQWKELLKQRQNHYFAYVYSTRCGHCNDIKQDVIEFALGYRDLYFVEFNKDIPVFDNPNETIGETDINNVYIVGTPTLFEIENHRIKENIAGSNRIIETLTNYK